MPSYTVGVTIGTRGRLYNHTRTNDLVVSRLRAVGGEYGPWEKPTPADRRDYLKAKKKRVGRRRPNRPKGLLGLLGL